MIRLSVILILALGVAASADATRFYKWIDEDGVVHYSDSPPDHGRFEQIETRDPASSFEELEAFRDDAQEDEREDGDAQEAASVPAPTALAEVRRLNCENARHNLETLTTFDNVQMDVDGDGEPELLNEEQKQQQIERMQAQVEVFCDEE
jgi:hypothetical protein